MAIRYLKKHAALEGWITADDAESLGSWLKSQARPAVNLAKCEQIHAAVLQVLLALRPQVTAPPVNPWLAHALAGLAPPAKEGQA